MSYNVLAIRDGRTLDGKEIKAGQKITIDEIAGSDGTWSQTRTAKSGEASTFTCYKHMVFEVVFDIAGLRITNYEVKDGSKSPGRWIQLGGTDNNMTYVREYLMESPDGRRGWAIGEANPQQARVNVGLAYMADKRAFDRCIIDLLKAVDVYSDLENEAMEKNYKPTLDTLEPEEKDGIKELLQRMHISKTKTELMAVGAEIRKFKEKNMLSDKAYVVVKDMFTKKLVAIKKSELADAKPKETADKPQNPTTTQSEPENTEKAQENTPKPNNTKENESFTLEDARGE
jgi:hypothetical protein